MVGVGDGERPHGSGDAIAAILGLDGYPGGIVLLPKAHLSSTNNTQVLLTQARSCFGQTEDQNAG